MIVGIGSPQAVDINVGCPVFPWSWWLNETIHRSLERLEIEDFASVTMLIDVGATSGDSIAIQSPIVFHPANAKEDDRHRCYPLMIVCPTLNACW